MLQSTCLKFNRLNSNANALIKYKYLSGVTPSSSSTSTSSSLLNLKSSVSTTSLNNNNNHHQQTQQHIFFNSSLSLRLYSNNNNNNDNILIDVKKPKTAIVMLNLGGPQTLDQVEPFLRRLFSDRDIIKLPFQEWAGRLIAKRRAPAVRKLYEAIGGGSPIGKWTKLQARALEKQLDVRSPATAPHKAYIGFRYADPLIDSTIDEMKRDGIKRAIAFTQYPHYSCTTTGSSLNNLWKTLEAKDMVTEFEWSIIDRWPLHPGFIKAVTTNLKQAITKFGEQASKLGVDNKPVIVFSAHSLPMKTVERGDPYPGEITATVQAVMQAIGGSDKYASILCWQSKVGPLPWLVPKTVDIIAQLARDGKNAIVVPIAFTSDHIETLSEIDIELQHIAKENGMKLMVRSDSLNDNPLIIDAMTDIVHQHILSNQPIANSTAYQFKCPGCIDQSGSYCRTVRNPIQSKSESLIEQEQEQVIDHQHQPIQTKHQQHHHQPTFSITSKQKQSQKL